MINEYIDEVNRVRDEKGKASLGWSDACEVRAKTNAATVARVRNRLWHPGNPGEAEIAARGQSDIAKACVGWLGSPGHRAILLSDQFVSVGVAMVVAVDGQPVWFAQFE